MGLRCPRFHGGEAPLGEPCCLCFSGLPCLPSRVHGSDRIIRELHCPERWGQGVKTPRSLEPPQTAKHPLPPPQPSWVREQEGAGKGTPKVSSWGMPTLRVGTGMPSCHPSPLPPTTLPPWPSGAFLQPPSSPPLQDKRERQLLNRSTVPLHAVR